MKTATITFHAPNNNGSFLQAYALQQTLKNNLKVENQIINFTSKKQIRQYSLLRFPRSIGDIGRNLISLMHYSSLKKRVSRFENMRNNYLDMTAKCTNEEEVYEIAKKYDTIICGSDQIWNINARDFSPAYFMPNYKGKKISYATSFGTNTVSEGKDLVKSYLKDFSSLSLREKAGQVFLESMGINDTQLTCDPTLLLKKEDYAHLMSEKHIIKTPYIFLYTINYNDTVLKIANILSKKYNLPVYTPFTGYSCEKAKKYSINVLYDIGPSEFLRLVNDSEYVLSNSFHGTVFSIIYKKPYFRPGKWDTEKNTFIKDDRIDDFLYKIGMGNRAVYEKNGETVFPEEETDYSIVENNLKEICDKSLDYLKNSILG